MREFEDSKESFLRAEKANQENVSRRLTFHLQSFLEVVFACLRRNPR